MRMAVLLFSIGSCLAAGQQAKPAKPVSGQEAKPVRVETSVQAMGTTYQMVVYGVDSIRLKGALEQAAEEVQRLDRMLSNYRPESEWSEVNRNAAQRPVQVSQELFDLLARCLDYSRLSEGAFDVTVGPLMKTWGFYKGSGHLPHRSEIRAVLGRVGYRNVELDRTARTVRFLKSGVEMDPGGIGKGYAVDRMLQVLRENGVTSGLISAGTSSIYALGAPPNEPRGWKVSIRHPLDANKTAAEVYLKNESMSTSGNYEKFFEAEGQIFSHIMDPRTGWPAKGTLSVSVIAPRTIDSEAWTKPYFVNGLRWARAHKQPGFKVYFCSSSSDDYRSGSEQCEWLQ
jgi:thiamine biosynthesis lipoprotein